MDEFQPMKLRRRSKRGKKFASAEGKLSDASVDIYTGKPTDKWANKNPDTGLAEPTPDNVSDQQAEEWVARAKALKPPGYPRVDERAMNWQIQHERQKQTMRANPMYQFVMMVSAFANMKLERLWNTASEDAKLTKAGATSAPAIPVNVGEPTKRSSVRAPSQYQWTALPEINGILNLSPKLYGHMMEAYGILRRCGGCSISLESLVSDPSRNSLFARLVALRIQLSAFMSGLNYQLDANWRRLHREQDMVIRALKRMEGGVSRPAMLSLDKRMKFYSL